MPHALTHPHAHLPALSLQCSVSAAWPVGRSVDAQAAQALAGLAAQSGEAALGAVPWYWAGWGSEPAQLASAAAALGHLGRVRGALVFAGGALLSDLQRVRQTLACALQASQSEDPRAHCVVMLDPRTLYAAGGGIREPLLSCAVGVGRHTAAAGRGPESAPRAFPCRRLLVQGFRLQPDHPASEGAQIRAGAVREGCAWCPYLETPEP